MLDGDREKKLQELFTLAADLPPDEREAFMDRHCGDDSELRERLASLLAEDKTGTLLAGSAVPEPVTGDEIDRYELADLLGAGGMGSVYLARQTEPVKREVALKMIHPGLDSDEVVKRFEMERQTLAMMNHPAIAEIYDGGVTAGGQPYFVMEYVDGLPITEYCDQRRLTLNERLQLFCRVCSGVQHAHQKAIIHRDLKPKNVLVTDKGRDALPKIIDFGIARAVARSPEQPILSTTTGGVVGTLLYMSPEQADPKGTPLDTRTDIYSLGVIFYELLAGRPPFDADVLGEKGIVEAQRILRDTDPPTPSARVAGLGDAAAAVAADRRLTSRSLVRALEGDLDWITMKALEKDRNRRYATAAEMRADIERHLADEPVDAGPPTMSYRTGKFIVRHRVAVGVLSLLLLTLIVGMVAATLAWQEAEHERQIAEHERRKVESERSKVQAVVDFLTDVLLRRRPLATGSGDVTVDQMLDEAIEHIDRTFAGRPDAEGAVRQILGRAFFQLGELADARQQFDLAYKLTLTGTRREQFAALIDLIRVTRLTEGAEATIPYEQRALELAVAELSATYPALAAPLKGMQELLRMDRPTSQVAEMQLDALATALPTVQNLSQTEFAMVARVVGQVAGFLDRKDVRATKVYIEALERATRSVVDTNSVSFMLMLAVYADYWLGERNFEAAQRIGEELREKRATLVIPVQSWLYYEGDVVYGLARGGLGETAEAEKLLLDVFDKIEQLPATTQRLRNAQQALKELCDEIGAHQQLDAFLKGSWGRWRDRPDARDEFRPWWPIEDRIEVPRSATEAAIAIVRRAAEASPEDGHTLSQLGIAEYRAGNHDKALAALSRADQLNSKANPYDLIYTARAELAKKQADRARAARDELRTRVGKGTVTVPTHARAAVDRLDRELSR